MTTEKAIEVLEATPLMRMEQNHAHERSELGEAIYMAIQALKEKLAVEDDLK